MKKPRICSQIGTSSLLQKAPLVEIAGENRVLIENHVCILGYSSEEIQVKVSYGKISVLGGRLKLLELSRDQLVITGRIDAVQIFGGKS